MRVLDRDKWPAHLGEEGVNMRVKLHVDGREVPLNPFVNKLIGSLIQALVSTLHGVEEGWRLIELEVERGGQEARGD